MSLQFDNSINYYYLDDTENDFSNFEPSYNTSQSIKINLDKNLDPPETYRKIIVGSAGDITNNDNSERNSPYFIVSHEVEKEQIKQEKKRRGRQVKLNSKRSKKKKAFIFK